jgi:hypothetical protein
VRNRLVTRVARAAAAVGAQQPARALADLDVVDKGIADSRTVDTLVWPHATADDVAATYRLIASGLRANANRQLGHLDVEARSIAVRREILDKQRVQFPSRAQIARDQMLSEAQLAWNASRRSDATEAGLWLGRALVRADDLRAQAHGVSDKEMLDVLRLAAELTVSMGRPLVVDLPKRLDAALNELGSRHEPSLRSYERWFEIYAPLVSRAP